MGARDNENPAREAWAPCAWSRREIDLSPLTVADQLIDVLLEAGVELIYGVVGDSLNPVVEDRRERGAARRRAPR